MGGIVQKRKRATFPNSLILFLKIDASEILAGILAV